MSQHSQDAQEFGELETPQVEEKPAKKLRLAEASCQVCGRHWPLSFCINIGTEAYPSHRCKACHLR